MRRSFVASLICGISLVTASHALQVKSAKNNEKIVAIISAKELSRIFVLGDRIQSIRGLSGAYELSKDEKQGSIYIKPTPFYAQHGFSLFITTERMHTYQLFLTPKETPSETIELKDSGPWLIKPKLTK